MTTQHRRLRRTLLLGPVLLAAMVAGGCAAGGGDEAGSSSAEPAMAADAPVAERNMADGLDSGLAVEDGAATAGGAKAEDVSTPSGVREPAIISTGVVSLRDPDVADARFEVQKVIDGHQGQVAEENTETNDEGLVNRSRLVVRVPAQEFGATMEELKKIGVLESATSGSEDVTTQVIDTEVRIRAQEQSIERIEVLLARAQSIRDIVAIESQLTRRQADLDSLKSQQAWLTDQTSLSTITIHLQQPPKHPTTAKDDSGFLAGLAAGWHAMTRALVAGATLVGLLVPFLLVLLVLGVPAWLMLRRLRRHWRREQAATPEPEGSAA
jgi:Domain of unknown function (DUF4349)